ncbi:hypothetical protein BN1221_03347c [Brenneria goodwinii]|uniref:Uncharacterized protein n=1 Tax=Brenneria goodwinii TaxID=1109412 RepID=A0A0G4JYC1_9GAMM|nr:hypothetical protein BN1221_03347c [Brenneria goodwinii]
MTKQPQSGGVRAASTLPPPAGPKPDGGNIHPSADITAIAALYNHLYRPNLPKSGGHDRDRWRQPA